MPIIPEPIVKGNYLLSIGFKPSKLLGIVKDKLYVMQIEQNLSEIELQKRAKIMLEEKI